MQTLRVLGHANPSGGVLAILQNLPDLFAHIKFHELFLSVMTVAMLFLMPSRFKSYISPQLLALIVVTLISVLILTDNDIRRIGEIPTGGSDDIPPICALPGCKIGGVSPVAKLIFQTIIFNNKIWPFSVRFLPKRGIY